jgi:hypothetical protein
MSDLCRLIWCALIGLFRSRASLDAEILVLRHQLNVLRRKSPKRLAFSNVERLVFVGLYRLAPGVYALKILKPQTVIHWHRAGFRAYWRWKSQSRAGRPKTPADIRQLIRDMSVANPLWGAPRIHGELLKLGIDVGQTTVAKYMARKAATVAGLEDLSAQSCRRHCVDGFVCCPDNLVSAVVWISDLASFPPSASVAGCDRMPERPLARPSTDRSLRLAADATIYRSRSGLRLW